MNRLQLTTSYILIRLTTQSPVEPPPPLVKPPRDAPVMAHVRYYLRRLGPAGPLAIIASTFPTIGTTLLIWFMAPLSAWLRGHAATGPVIYAGAFVILGGLALMPTYTYSALGGWAFGFWIGLAAAMSGYIGAALVGYGIARVVCGDRIVGLLEEQPKWRAVYDELLRSSQAKALLIVTLVRLASSPFAITNLVFAAAKTKLWIYVLGTLIGLSIRTGVVVYMAAKVGGVTFSFKEHKWMLFGGIAAAVVVIFVITHMAQRAIERVTKRQPAGEIGA
jgi:uncharacterized membrane protein YdjX (TVP38/TMEM64 family)